MASQRVRFATTLGNDSSIVEPPRKAQRRTGTYLILLAAIVFLFGIYGWTLNTSPEIIVTKAVAVMTGPTAEGVVYFAQDPSTRKVTITGSVKNLSPNSQRGFHIHEFGDATNGCMSSGAHYNPEGRSHGAPHEAVRHIGDLGNVQANANGIVQLDITDSRISLNGPYSIIGRTVVIHDGSDDLGKGGHPDSLKTGNAGSRVGCAVIGIAS